jgi:hypothetical protein
VHQRRPGDFADDLEQVPPHEEEAADQCNRDTDIPDEQVRVCVDRAEIVEVHSLRMGMCLYPVNFITGRQTRTKYPVISVSGAKKMVARVRRRITSFVSYAMALNE